MGAADTLNGAFLGLLVVASIVSWPLVWALLRWYRRSVVRVMRRPTEPVVEGPATPPHADATVATGGSAPAPEPRWWGDADVRDRLRHRALSRRRAVWGRHAVGGALAATVLAVATLAGAGSAVLPGRTLVVWTVSAWPIVLTLVIVAGIERRMMRRLVAGYVAILIVGGLAVGNLAAPVLLWALLAGIPTVVVVAWLHPSVRAVGVVVVAFVFIALAGTNALVSFVATSNDRIAAVSRTATAVGGGAIAAFVAMLVVGFGMAGLVGWVALRWFGHVYRRHGLPADVVLTTAVWALFAAMQGLPLAFTSPVLALSTPAAILAYLLAVIRRIPADGRTGPSLLLLRVFAGGPRNERLLRQITQVWRDVGPMRLIGGPDVARASVEPDEFMRFAAGRVGDLFVTSRRQLAQRRADPREVRDRHGQYRVQEFLCEAHTWRPVMHALMGDADLVVMDVRALGAGNDGVRHELAMLVGLGMLRRTVLVVDHDTDERLVAGILQSVGGRLSEATTLVVDDHAVTTEDLAAALPALTPS